MYLYGKMTLDDFRIEHKKPSTRFNNNQHIHIVKTKELQKKLKRKKYKNIKQNLGIIEVDIFNNIKNIDTYLSTKYNDRKYNDNLLNKLNIFHIHISPIISYKHSSRTENLLFFCVYKNTIYFLDILNHNGFKKPLHFINIIINNNFTFLLNIQNNIIQETWREIFKRELPETYEEYKKILNTIKEKNRTIRSKKRRNKDPKYKEAKDKLNNPVFKIMHEQLRNNKKYLFKHYIYSVFISNISFYIKIKNQTILCQSQSDGTSSQVVFAYDYYLDELKRRGLI